MKNPCISIPVYLDYKNRIFNLLDQIENRTGNMAHTIPDISDKLRQWQNGQLKDSYFMATLTRYWDQINK